MSGSSKQKIKTRLRDAWMLASPSWTSAGVVLFAAMTIILSHLVVFLPGNETFGNFLYGREGIITALEAYPVAPPAWLNNVITDSASHNFYIFLIAISAGLVTFVLIRAVNSIFYDAAKIQRIWLADPHLSAAGPAQIAKRAAVRALLAFLWLMFCFYTIDFVFPAVEEATSSGVDFLPETEGILQLVCYAFLPLAATFHCHVVFLRLIALRFRLVGP